MQSLAATALVIIVVFLLVLGAGCLAMMMRGALKLRLLDRERPRGDKPTLLKSPLVPAVSVIVAPPDAGPDSRAFVRLLVALHYGTHDVVLALDGPSDAELAAWNEEFNLTASMRQVGGPLPMGTVRAVLESRDPICLVVVVLQNRGRTPALNAAVNAAQSPVIGIFGPECEFEPECLLSLIPAMLEYPRETIAICGLAPAPPAKGWVTQFAALDFLRGWLGRHAAFSTWNLLTPNPGCALLVKRDVILKAGGFRTGAVELVLRLLANAHAAKQPYRIAFVPISGCYQRPPKTLAELRKRLVRDQIDVMRILFNSAFPWWVRYGFFSVRFVRPLLETVAYVLTVVALKMGWIDWPLALLVLLSSAGLGLLLSLAAVALRELAQYRGSDPARLAGLFFAAFPENLGFRQIRNLWLLAPWGKRVDW